MALLPSFLLLSALITYAQAFVPTRLIPIRHKSALSAGNDVDERAVLRRSPPVIDPSSQPKKSPFYCDLFYLDKSLRTPADSGREESGRSWDAALQLGVAKQIIEDAAHDRSVTRRMLMGAVHCLEWQSLFGNPSPSSEDIAEQIAMLDGEWSLIFADGDTGINQGKDPHGYIKAGTDIDLFIDTSHGTACFSNRVGPTLSGPFTWDPYPCMSCDFRSGMMMGKGGEEVLLPEDDSFESSCRLSMIALEPSHLVVRYSQGDRNGVLLFCKGRGNAATPPPSKRMGISGGGVPRSSSSSSSPSSSSSSTPPSPGQRSAGVGGQQQQQEGKEKAIKNEGSLLNRKMVEVKMQADQQQQQDSNKATTTPPELDPDVLMVGGYDSFWEYLDEEAITIYVLLGFPALIKTWHPMGADYEHKLLLVQDFLDGLWQIITHGGATDLLPPP